MAHAKPLLAVLTLCAVAATIAVVRAQASQPQTEWRYYGGNKGFTRYSALDQINRDNVKSVRVAWRRPAVNDKMIAAFPDTRPNAYLRSTPIMIDGTLYRRPQPHLQAGGRPAGRRRSERSARMSAKSVGLG